MAISDDAGCAVTIPYATTSSYEASERSKPSPISQRIRTQNNKFIHRIPSLRVQKTIPCLFAAYISIKPPKTQIYSPALRAPLRLRARRPIPHQRPKRPSFSPYLQVRPKLILHALLAPTARRRLESKGKPFRALHPAAALPRPGPRRQEHRVGPAARRRRLAIRRAVRVVEVQVVQQLVQLQRVLVLLRPVLVLAPAGRAVVVLLPLPPGLALARGGRPRRRVLAPDAVEVDLIYTLETRC